MRGAARAQAQSSGRRFLFLQGPLSPLFRDIGHILSGEGHKVVRINLCPGDWLHWHDGETRSFKGRPSEWKAYVGDLMDREAITDLVVHGDQRLYHKHAISQANRRALRVFVTELGFLRSGWMTLEREGLATLSRFPCDPERIREISARAGEIDFSSRYAKSAWLEIVPDVIYNLANVFLRPVFPHYQRHTIYHPVPEYLRGAWRLATEGQRMRSANAIIAKLLETATPYFILPLQLEGDFQLRAHSPFGSFAEVIEGVMTSFAGHAPAAAKLVIKTHPLDVGFENWPGLVRSLSWRLDLKDRVIFLDGGGLSRLFEGAAGLVTLNSTSGLEALQAGVPVKTLVPAHYDIAGLTTAGELDAFWNTPQRPDPALMEDYLRAIAATIQVRGSIHNLEGSRAAAQNMARRILDLSVNEPGALLPEPPRLERARQLGVPL